MIRRNNRYIKRTGGNINRNKGIIGDSIEVMMERIRSGEGEDAIVDRDLVYNDNETQDVNPITNIRNDKFESLLNEKIGEYEHKHRKIAPKKEETEEGKTTESNDTSIEE